MALTVFKLPLVNVPQAFSITLAGVEYLITCKYNSAFEAGWVLDITDSISNLPVATNVPLVSGKDCLAGLEYLNINGGLIVLSDGNQYAVPTLDNLGVESNLYFVTNVTSG